MTVSYLAQARFSKPYIVVWNDTLLRGAWYDRLLRLRASDVSRELLAHARRHSRHELSDSLYCDLPAPEWAPRVSPADCDAWVLYDDASDEDTLAAIPEG